MCIKKIISREKKESREKNIPRVVAAAAAAAVLLASSSSSLLLLLLLLALPLPLLLLASSLSSLLLLLLLVVSVIADAAASRCREVVYLVDIKKKILKAYDVCMWSYCNCASDRGRCCGCGSSR